MTTTYLKPVTAQELIEYFGAEIARIGDNNTLEIYNKTTGRWHRRFRVEAYERNAFGVIDADPARHREIVGEEQAEFDRSYGPASSGLPA